MKDRILRHLIDYGSITSWDAIMEYGCTMLSHYIWLLKKDGYCFNEENVKTRNRYNEFTHYKRYIIVR